MRNIINIINFVRGIEPRPNRNIDLKLPVRQQLSLIRELGLRGTFLLQYDTLLDSEFTEIFKSSLDCCELGLWLEVVQPQVEAVGQVWRGRYPWDWFNDVGFLIGYEPSVRIRLVDEAMNKFKEIYGDYPRSVGSWHMDSVSMAHLSDKYGISAMCICRDQVGMDGYTLQGGYYNQGYYPSRSNMFCPANSKDTQINTPVFRMLGSDPIRAYDHMIVPYFNSTVAPTLEPAQGGRNDSYSRWLLETVTDGSGLCFGYAQIGQENSFGWDRMKGGINYQFRLAKELQDAGKAEVLTLGETGKWYISSFELTPPATVKALDSGDESDYKSVWYYSRFYRADLLWHKGIIRFRDMYIFNDKYKEHYLDRRCDSTACEFRNLPIMDAMLYSTKDITAGIYLCSGGEPLVFDSMEYLEDGDNATVLLSSAEGSVRLVFYPDSISLCSDIPNLSLCSKYDKDALREGHTKSGSAFTNHNNTESCLSFVSKVSICNNTVHLTFDSFDYSLKVEKGVLNSFLDITSDKGEILLSLLQQSQDI